MGLINGLNFKNTKVTKKYTLTSMSREDFLSFCMEWLRERKYHQSQSNARAMGEGGGDVLVPKLRADICDIRKFHRAKAFRTYAAIRIRSIRWK